MACSAARRASSSLAEQGLDPGDAEVGGGQAGPHGRVVAAVADERLVGPQRGPEQLVSQGMKAGDLNDLALAQLRQVGVDDGQRLGDVAVGPPLLRLDLAEGRLGLLPGDVLHHGPLVGMPPGRDGHEHGPGGPHEGDDEDDGEGRQQIRLGLVAAAPEAQPLDSPGASRLDRFIVDEPAEVLGHRGGRGVAPSRVLLDRLQDDRLQVARDARVGQRGAAPAPRS